MLSLFSDGHKAKSQSGIGAKTGVVVGARFVTRGAQLVSFVILARSLSVEAFGTYGILTSAVFLAALIGNLGLRQAAAHRIGKNDIGPRELASTLLVAWPFLSLICSFSIWYYFKDSLTSLGANQAVLLHLSILAVMFLTLLQGIFLGQGQTNTFALLESGPRVFQSFLILLLWLSGTLTTFTAILTFAVGFIIFIPFSLLRIYSTSGGSWIPKFELIPSLIKFGFMFSASLFLIMLQGRVGLFFLHGAYGAVEAGHFFAAQRTTEIFLDVATGAALVLFSEAARGRDPKASMEQSARVAANIFATFLVIGLLGFAFAPLAVRLVLGPAYAAAKPTLMILCVGLAPMAATRIMNSVISGLGRPWISAIVAAAGLIMNFGLCGILIPLWGANGAAIALVVGQSSCLAAYILLSRYIFKIDASCFVPNIKLIAKKIMSVAGTPLSRR